MAKETNKKTGRGNKTAHVLSLLTDTDTDVEIDPSERPVRTQRVEKQEEKPIVEKQKDSSAEIENQIKNALESELLGETQAPAEEKPASDNYSLFEEVVEAEETPETIDEVVPVAEETIEKEYKSDPLDTPPSISSNTFEGISYINVMQRLVEEKADKYIKMFNLCNCPRCRVDVIALTLTHLPAKYVVVKGTETVPMLTVYEGNYSARIISEIMNSCKTVMENPRHKNREL